MSDSTTPSTPDQVRLEKLERTVRRLRRWLWVALIVGIAFLSFVFGRISGSRQMDRSPGMQGPQFNMQGPPQMQGGNGPQSGPNGGKGSPNDRGEGKDNGKDKK